MLVGCSLALDSDPSDLDTLDPIADQEPIDRGVRDGRRIGRVVLVMLSLVLFLLGCAVLAAVAASVSGTSVTDFSQPSYVSPAQTVSEVTVRVFMAATNDLRPFGRPANQC